VRCFEEMQEGIVCTWGQETEDVMGSAFQLVVGMVASQFDDDHNMEEIL
jgi:hypothetical protein